MSTNETSISRRRVVQSLGAVGAVGLAGCGSGGQDNDDGDPGTAEETAQLGERVPTIELEYWTGLGGLTQFMEASLPSMRKTWTERLDLDINIRGLSIGNQWGGTNNDERTHHLAYWAYSTRLPRLDPNFGIQTLRIDSAGADGRQNGANYASCAHSVPGLEQETTVDPEERQQLINEAEYAQSQDIAMIPISSKPTIGAARTDQIEMESTGSFGITPANAIFIANTRPIDNPDRRLVGSARRENLRSINPFGGTQWGKPAYNYTLYSPLVIRGPDTNFHPYAAEDWEVSEDGTTLTFYLQENMTFHDGRELTSADVKFTYEMADEFGEDIPAAAFLMGGKNLEAVNVVDEKTVELQFANPSLSFLQSQIVQGGILNKQYWEEEGADQNPGDFQPEPGHQSGPFNLVQFNRGENFIMDSHPGHPFAPDPDEMQGLIIQGFADQASTNRALEEGSIDYMVGISRQTAAQFADRDNITVTFGLECYSYHVNPQYSFGPTKFREFRLALGKALNRREIIDLTDPTGNSEPIMHARMFLETHPWAPPTEGYTKITDNPQGETDGARQVLEDEGWGWDSDGNLRYPADADLTPRWPEGEEPSEDDYPCLEMF